MPMNSDERYSDPPPGRGEIDGGPPGDSADRPTEHVTHQDAEIDGEDVEQVRRQLLAREAELQAQAEQLGDARTELAEARNRHLEGVAEKQRTRAELERTNRLLGAVVDNTHAMMACLDTEFNFLWVNPAYAAASNRSPDYFTGKNHFDLYPHRENEAIFREVVETGEPKFFQAKPFDHPDRPHEGTSYWDWSLVPVKDAGGNVERLVFSLLDVSDHVRAQGVIAGQLAEIEAIYRSAGIGLCALNPNLEYVRVNERLAHMNGLPPEEHVGRTPSEVVPDLAPRIEPIVRHVLETGEPMLNVEFSGTIAGEPEVLRYFSTHWVPIETEDGHIVGVNVALEDITDLKQAENALRESRALLSSAFENAPFDFWVRDTEGRCILQNPCSVALWGDQTGKKPKESGAPWEEIIDWNRACQRALGGETVTEETSFFRDGRERHFQTIAAPYRVDGEVRGVLGFNFDITDLKETQQKLKELNATLEQRVAERTAELAARSEQLRRLAHELSTTEDRERRRLATILHDDMQQTLAYAKLRASALTREEIGTEKRVKAAEDVVDAIGDALQASRSLTYELSPPLLHGEGLGAALRWLARRMQDGFGLQVDVHVAEDAGQPEEEVRVLAYQAAREMLYNVVKHAETDSACLHLTCREGMLTISVADEGVGLDPAAIAEGAEEEQGFGLLNISERAQVFGGALSVEGAPGAGSRFVLRLPAEKRET